MKWNTRNILAYLYAKSLILSGAPTRGMRNFRQSGDVLSIYFHDPSKHLFERSIKWLISHGVNFISTDDLMAYSKGGTILPESPVLITVDDGWKGNKENIIEVAKQYHIPVTLFISTDPVLRQLPFWWSFNQKKYQEGISYVKTSALKKWSNKERLAYLNGYGFSTAFSDEAMEEHEIREADSLSNIFIESHTVSHPILTMCTDVESEEEIYSSKKELERVLGRKIKGLAYPNGSYGQREVALLKKHGYDYGFTTRPDYLNLSKQKNLYELPRIEVMENVSFAENKCRIAGLWIKCKHQRT